MKLGLCTIAFQDKPLEEVIDIAADHGFDGIELWGKPPHLPTDYDENYAKNVKDMAQRKGLEISAFGSYIDPLMHLHQKHFEEAFKIAHDLGTDVVRIWSGGGPSRSITSTDKRLIHFRLVSITQWANFRNIRLGLEMHNNHLTDNAESILAIIEDVKLPALKTYYQPLVRADADEPHAAAEKLAAHIVNVHAQNFDENGKACPIAEGVVDYARIVEILSKAEYDGYLEVEFVHGDNKLEALQRDRDYLASLINTTDTEALKNLDTDPV
ncbi:sugar phosphate isomerase/epimerase [Candidatus Poribacteria bacterium]|nr:sugar phosphate isomerase/epimerase [Candidatus Poribacteria bacterium]